MQENIITFQLATHFLPKIALRLECLHNTIKQASTEVHPVIHHYALQNITEILLLIQKPELKSRFLKELMRIEHTLNKMNTVISAELYSRLYAQIQILTHVVGRFGDGIHQDPFLNSMKSAQTNHNLDCETLSPQLLVWLESSPEQRQQDLSLWLKSLRALDDTVNLYLSLLRNSGHYLEIELYNGFYQQALPRHSCHLILVKMQKNGIIPMMQLGHHGLSLRLCEATTMREIRDQYAKLAVAICQL